MATKVGGVLYDTYDGMTWIQWAKGRKSDLTATDFGLETFPPDHPLYPRLKAVFDVLIEHGRGSHVRLEQEEWDALVRPTTTAREEETQTSEG